MIRPVGGPPPEVPKEGSPSPQVQTWIDKIKKIIGEIKAGGDAQWLCSEIGQLAGQIYAFSPSQYHEELVGLDGVFGILNDPQRQPPDPTKLTNALVSIEGLLMREPNATPPLPPADRNAWVDLVQKAQNTLSELQKWPDDPVRRKTLVFQLSFIQGILHEYSKASTGGNYARSGACIQDALQQMFSGTYPHVFNDLVSLVHILSAGPPW